MCPWERAVHLRSHFLQRKEAERTLGQQQSGTMSSFKGSTIAGIVTGWTQGHKQKSEMSRHMQTLESCLLVTSMETGRTVYQVGQPQRRRPPTAASCSAPDPVKEENRKNKKSPTHASLPKDGGHRVSRTRTVSHSQLFPVVLMGRTSQREPAGRSGDEHLPEPALSRLTYSPAASTEALWRQAQEARSLGGADAQLQKALHVSP